MAIEIDHVALQVSSVQVVADELRSRGCPVGDAQTFAEEGTREVYVGPEDHLGRLLLIEPIQSGPYQRSMAKRGPGLHHLAVCVPNVEEYVGSLAGTGWFLHVSSLTSHREARTVWLASPGAPVLVEVVEGDSPEAAERETFVSAVEIPMSDDAGRLDALGMAGLSSSPDHLVWLTFEGCRVSCGELPL